MDQEKLLSLAMEQSAIDMNCAPKDFLRGDNVVVDFCSLHKDAKRYYKEPIAANFLSFGNNVVAAVAPAYRQIVESYLQKYAWYHCFETPNLHVLQESFAPLGQKIAFMAEYWLPDLHRLQNQSCPYELRLLSRADFAPLYLPCWSNALCSTRPQLDMLAVGAYDKGELIALAGCSADAKDMWQIGIDVLPAYRRKGIATALVSNLALACLQRDKVPFYCCAWSNLPSARTAFSAGFSPAWVEMTVKRAEEVDEMNR